MIGVKPLAAADGLAAGFAEVAPETSGFAAAEGAAATELATEALGDAGADAAEDGDAAGTAPPQAAETIPMNARHKLRALGKRVKSVSLP